MKKNYYSEDVRCGIRRGPCRGIVRKLCLILVICTVAVPQLFGQSGLTVKKQSVPMKEVISDIEGRTSLKFVYSTEALNSIGTVSVNVTNGTISDVMAQCLRGTQYTYSISDNTVVIKRVPPRVITGIVVNKANNTPMPGVSVIVAGTTTGTTTDVKGNFKISTTEQDPKLEFSFIGMQKVEMKPGSKNALNVSMMEVSKKVDNVTVIAFGERNTRELITSVSTIKAEDIDEIPSASFDNLLQGRLSGVEVTNITGAPGGGGTSVRVRGYNSLLDGKSDGSPLYVIDGVPMSSFTSPITGTNTLAEIDPSTIASVDVLKDAASAAMYGSRASNGVILITTKEGQSGKGKFSANVSYSYSILPTTPTQTIGNGERNFRLQSGRNSIVSYNDWMTNTIKTPGSYNDVYNTAGIYDYFWGNGSPWGYRPDEHRILQDSLNPFYNNSTNWWKYVFRAGKILNANFQTSGGNDNVRYMVGAGWYDEEGIMYGSDFSRLNVISNVNLVPRKNLKIDSRTYLSYSDRRRGQARGSAGASVDNFERLTIDPKKQSSLLPGNGFLQDELMKKINESAEKNTSMRIRTSLNAAYQILPELSVSSMVAIDYNQIWLNSFSPSVFDPDGWSASAGSVVGTTMFSNDNLITYRKTFNSRHNFDALLGFSYSRNSTNNISGSGMNGPSDKMHYVTEGFPDLLERYGTILAAKDYYSNYDEIMLLGYFGRVAYNFDKRYLTEFTLRRDGSSSFGEDVRWGTFPSVAVGWAFSEESFLKNLWWLSFGKVRFSWGRAGQHFSEPYLAHGKWSVGSGFLGNPGLLPETMLDTRLTWEESDQYDVGLDLNLFDYRVKFKVDYYYKYSRSLLNTVEMPGDVYLMKNTFKNAVDISNQGLEFEFSVDIFRDKAVDWRVRFNISRNWNKFEKMITNQDIARKESALVLGRPVYGIYTFKDKGIITKEEDIPVYYDAQGNKRKLKMGSSNYMVGMRLLDDLNNDGRIDDDDRYYAASALPLAYGGIASELKWKGFDLSILFTYTLGRHVVNNYSRNTLGFEAGMYNALLADYSKVNFWSPQNPTGNFPSLSASMNRYYAAGQYSGGIDSAIEKVNYIRLKQLTLGYNVPKTFSRKIGFDGIRMFFTAENLFLLSNYSGVDPETLPHENPYDNFEFYPLARKMTLGLTLSF